MIDYCYCRSGKYYCNSGIKRLKYAFILVYFRKRCKINVVMIILLVEKEQIALKRWFAELNGKKNYYFQREPSIIHLKQKKMRQKKNCFQNKSLEIVNNEILSSEEDFMSEELVKNSCSDECCAKSLCITIIQKLNHNNYIGANVLLNTLKGWYAYVVVLRMS